MNSSAQTVEEYIENLPEERKSQISEVRQVILNHLPEGFVEVMNWGMITYEVPLSIVPDTYNGKPLMYAALASQKNHMAVYLSGIYANETLKETFLKEYRATGKKLDMGKSCVRFKKIEEFPVEVIGNAIGAVSMDEFINFYHSGRRA